MVVIRWKFRGLCRRLRECVAWKISQAVLIFRSLTYNEHMNQSYAIDFLLEPVFWFVDNFAQYLGKVFVFCVTVLTSAVVGVAYWVGLPYWWQRCPYTTVFLVIFGNWLLINIIFHTIKELLLNLDTLHQRLMFLKQLVYVDAAYLQGLPVLITALFVTGASWPWTTTAPGLTTAWATTTQDSSICTWCTWL
ncbi:unnamed protein product [Spodoptera littoralis]|uniref:Uncharacterized protein n=1 Tax=Spodoptera littoralis TaxID=7109 RepID=A0A9P0IMK7_SPOLI|nr:unnamed protein product [Spodoptera littoralis]CAH1647753.1 unnamed protein product [Spodoptera littoralis]